jgi:hypothetical protein
MSKIFSCCRPIATVDGRTADFFWEMDAAWRPLVFCDLGIRRDYFTKAFEKCIANEFLSNNWLSNLLKYYKGHILISGKGSAFYEYVISLKND